MDLHYWDVMEIYDLNNQWWKSKINHREDEKIYGSSQYILIWILDKKARIVPCHSWPFAIVKLDTFQHDQNCYCDAQNYF